jgi:hypothetical protein
LERRGGEKNAAPAFDSGPHHSPLAVYATILHASKMHVCSIWGTFAFWPLIRDMVAPPLPQLPTQKELCAMARFMRDERLFFFC